MVPDTDIELIDFLDPSLAAIQQNNDHSFDHCDNMFNSMFTCISTCKYFDMNSKLFNNSRNSNSLILLHLNIRSLLKNFDLLYEFLESLTVSPDIICLTETRIKNCPLININIPNYRFMQTQPQLLEVWQFTSLTNLIMNCA